MTVAQKLSWNESPEQQVLQDCDRVVCRARRIVSQIEGHTAQPDDVRRLVRDVHSVKGAVGFINRRGLAEALHRLESLLTGSLSSAGGIGMADIAGLFHDLDRHLNGGIGWASNSSKPERLHRFGESLWWTNELTQSTAAKLGKRAFVLVRGGHLPVSLHIHRVLQSILVHLVRNAIVHGLETPEVRSAAGKSEIGLIVITAGYGEAGLVISVTDNGAGLNEEAIGNLFIAGHSTADEVTELAGRGVGLATVRELIEEAGGRIEVNSIPGDGLTFTLTFPDH